MPEQESSKEDLKSILLELHEIHDNIKLGYNEYGMYFWFTTLGVLIGAFFHLTGVAAFILTLVFFYLAGRGHSKLKAASKEAK